VQLVQQCIDGKRAAYKVLYERYARAMYNTALRIVNHAPDAEDILQEAFTDAFAQLGQLENRTAFGVWLKRIVVLKSISFLKKKRLVMLDLADGAEGPPEETPEDEADVVLTVERIKQKMQALPAGYRTVLSLYLLEGYDHEEIAAIMGVTHSTVRTQYSRAKQKLLQMLKA
jgi:RNA polymerase sigma factor (sigma-70 family)